MKYDSLPWMHNTSSIFIHTRLAHMQFESGLDKHTWLVWVGSIAHQWMIFCLFYDQPHSPAMLRYTQCQHFSLNFSVKNCMCGCWYVCHSLTDLTRSVMTLISIFCIGIQVSYRYDCQRLSPIAAVYFTYVSFLQALYDFEEVIAMEIKPPVKAKDFMKTSSMFRVAHYNVACCYSSLEQVSNSLLPIAWFWVLRDTRSLVSYLEVYLIMETDSL